MARMKAPEETGEGPRPARTGPGKEFDGGGFKEGTHGRGPTPYKRSHSHKNGAGMSTDQYEGPAGRGGSGVIGKGDDFKQRTSDIEHPSSHAAFERLGHSEE